MSRRRSQEQRTTVRFFTQRGGGALDTLDAALEEGLAPLAGPHAVVVTRGVVVTHGAEVHIHFGGGGGGAQG